MAELTETSPETPETTEAIRAVEAFLNALQIHRIGADGAAVLTERTDALIIGPLRVQFWVCGVFEVDDGRITLWRDYFDVYDMFKGLLRGLVALVVPSLKATL